jgi:hypothetical protein
MAFPLRDKAETLKLFGNWRPVKTLAEQYKPSYKFCGK